MVIVSFAVCLCFFFFFYCFITFVFFFFFFNDTATTEIYTLSLHDALPIYTLSQNVHALVYDIHSGKGSLSRLINDDQLVRRWEATANELEALITDIRENPGKYVRSEEHTSELQSH